MRSMKFRSAAPRGLLSFILVLSITACELQEEVVSADGQDIITIKALIKDSFERETLDGSTEDAPLNWRGFIWDWGSPVIGSSGRNVAAVMMGQGSMGAPSDGDKALYFYGRQGHSIHNIYLMTRSFDLSEFDRVKIEFDYLLFDLNDAQDISDGVEEYLRVEVCTGELDACGVGESLNASALRNGPWQVIFESDGSEMHSGLNGKNHTASDWKRASFELDLSRFQYKEQFSFRFNARMRDGFVSNNLNLALEDGVAVDRIEAWGERTVVVGEPDIDNPEPSPCDPDLPFMNPMSCDYIPVFE